MKTYQDWLKVSDGSETARMQFIKQAIQDFENDKRYKDACTGEDYYSGRNTTIKRLEKIIYNAKGQAVQDVFSANHKLATRFFYRSVKQATSVLLGNGIKWKDGKGEEILGADFDRRIMEAAREAQVGGVAYGFFNNNRVMIFTAKEFVPLVDEEDGAIKAGFRFWQISSNKPMRATAYELDGYTEYMWDKDHPDGVILYEKRSYLQLRQESVADGEEIYNFTNYPSFPIVPLYANEMKESELNPIRATIDAFDLINSGYADDIDDANIIYWTITNAGGMDDEDLVTFLNKMRKMRAAQLDNDQEVTPHVVDVPYNGRESILDRLEKQLYKDAMALNIYDLASGAVTATQIEAAYEPLNEKLDGLAATITAFITSLLSISGEEDEPTYDRSIIVNKAEEIQSVINAAAIMPDSDYITEKLLTILGDKDMIDDVKKRIAEDSLGRFAGLGIEGTETAPEE